jgi:putative transposase
VFGMAMGSRMTQDFALRALNVVIATRKPKSGCRHHTHYGSQYCAHDYQDLLRQHGLSPWICGKGRCCDNSAVESFFKSLNAALVRRRSWNTRRDADVAHFEYINSFYSSRRKHAALGRKSPIAVEWRAALGKRLTGTKPSQIQSGQRQHGRPIHARRLAEYR